MLDDTYTLVSCYAPNQEMNRITFFQTLQTWVNTYASNLNNVIIAGDLNCAIRDMDRVPVTHLADKSRNELRSIISSLNLVDLWVDKCGDEPGFTYFDKKNNSKSRLDYILISKSISLDNVSIEVTSPINQKHGDHKGVNSLF